MTLLRSGKKTHTCLPPRLLFSAVLVLITAFGCSKSDPSVAAIQVHASEPADEHADEHDPHDHDHHHDPQHKPENLPGLVASLNQRLQATEFSEHQWKEILDIVRWIPELAADSDLRRQDFELAMQISERLLAELNQPAPREPISISQEVIRSIGLLKDLAARSDNRPNSGSGMSDAGLPATK